MTRLGWLALVIYVAGRLVILFHSHSATNPLWLAGLAYFAALFLSIGHGWRAGAFFAAGFAVFHLVLFDAARERYTQSAELRLIYNFTLAMIAIVPGYLADLNRKLDRVVQVKEFTEAELRQKNVELERLARTDPLTELFNRRAFYDYAESIFALSRRHGRTFGVALLDLDHFKTVNDTYGHAAGDHALRQIAACLRSSARAGDLVARFGGEEFIVLLPETDAAGATSVATKLKNTIASLELEFDSGRTRITASIGVTALQPQDQRLDEVIARADGALYEAKALGRDHIGIA
ncbi:MAG TPA: GGDEF domain-containing protein [Candidatus Methylomirabilis sp.]|nr:GGDEF domain-containing protein [Candidatus Methylomirabilis sp.]